MFLFIGTAWSCICLPTEELAKLIPWAVYSGGGGSWRNGERLVVSTKFSWAVSPAQVRPVTACLFPGTGWSGQAASCYRVDALLRNFQKCWEVLTHSLRPVWAEGRFSSPWLKPAKNVAVMYCFIFSKGEAVLLRMKCLQVVSKWQTLLIFFFIFYF